APLGAGKLHFKPLWVLLVFFLPVFYLFLPFYVVDEIWRESESVRVGKGDNAGFRDSIFEYQVKRWWAVFLLHIVFIPVIWLVLLAIGKPLALELVGLAGNLVLLWWISLSINLIREITNRQQSRYDS